MVSSPLQSPTTHSFISFRLCSPSPPAEASLLPCPKEPPPLCYSAPVLLYPSLEGSPSLDILLDVALFIASFLFQNVDPVRRGFSGGASGKEPTCQCRRCERCGFDPLGRKDSLEEGMATPCSILAWRIPGQRSLAGYRLRGCKESDTTEHARMHGPCEDRVCLPCRPCYSQSSALCPSIVGTP